MKLTKILDHIKRNIPFYFDIDVDNFSTIPIVTKKEIKKRYEDFLSISVDGREKILQELNQDFTIHKYIIEKRICKNLIMEWTTGSSGIPFKSVKSLAERKQISLCMWKRRMEIDRQIIPTKFFTMIHTGSTPNKFDVRNYARSNIEQLYEYIRNNDITCIHTTPNLIRKHLSQSSIDMDFFANVVPYIEVTGNYLEDNERKKFEDIFHAKVINLYGTIETWGIAYSGKDHMLYTMNDNVILEIIDEYGNPIQSIEKEGEIVLTTLNQFVMPFIRYKIGDRGEYIQFNGMLARNIIKLSRKRDIGKLVIGKETKDGENLVKQLMRKVFWKKDFNDIHNLCFLKKGFFLEVVLNSIRDKEIFEQIMYEEVKCSELKEMKVYFKYVTDAEFEILNPKGYLYMNKTLND